MTPFVCKLENMNPSYHKLKTTTDKLIVSATCTSCVKLLWTKENTFLCMRELRIWLKQPLTYAAFN